MREKTLTFEEAIISSEFHLVKKQRLAMVRRGLFEQLPPKARLRKAVSPNPNACSE